MTLFRHGSRRTVVAAQDYFNSTASRRYASRIDIPVPSSSRTGNLQVIEGCPSPTCQCREFPDGLDIEREQNINGSMASYAQQVLISTGRTDWKSRIEDEKEGGIIRQLKGLIGPRGKFSNPFHNVMLTNSSFTPTNEPTQADLISESISRSDSNSAVEQKNQDTHGVPPSSAFLLPSFRYIPSIPSDDASVEAFVRAFVLPTQLHQSHDPLTKEEKSALLRHPEFQKKFVGTRMVDEIIVLICGHGGRDQRCGVMGPILATEFKEKLQRQNVKILKDTPVAEAQEFNSGVEGYTPTARVGLISHIGGHKWAGNVIIYVPPAWRGHALAGKGIWYGRVAPAHVEGIVDKTIMDGKVIKEMFRGGIDEQSGEILRI